ncbi:hypothetical protein YC2023_008115 [Brassica napus]
MFSSCVKSKFVSFLGSYQFFGHDFEAIQEWICDVSATSPLQAIVPRVLLLETMCVDRFRNVSVWTTDIGHWELFISIAVYQLCLEGRFVRIFIRDGATFLRCYPWDGLTVTASSSVGLPEGKSFDCWSRWKLLVHACYILRSYGI